MRKSIQTFQHLELFGSKWSPTNANVVCLSVHLSFRIILWSFETPRELTPKNPQEPPKEEPQRRTSKKNPQRTPKEPPFGAKALVVLVHHTLTHYAFFWRAKYWIFISLVGDCLDERCWDICPRHLSHLILSNISAYIWWIPQWIFSIVIYIPRSSQMRTV